jgi:hypothetical protein
MTAVASITVPRFTETELSTLQRIEGLLMRHPYVRVELGGSGPIAAELEHVMSTRLALLHTEGAKDAGSEVGLLLGKLRDWEAQLAKASIDEEPSDEARLRYETTLLLHPAPQIENKPAWASAELTRLTRLWERLRKSRPVRSILAEKARQNRDFFRHGAMLPLYWMRRKRIRKLLPNVVLSHPGLRETLFAIEQVGPIVDNFAFEGAAGAPLSTSVAVADVAFLYMQLADEFLDELAAAAGGHKVAGQLIRSLYRHDPFNRPLRDLSLGHLRTIGIEPSSHITKFGITLSELFGVLEQLATTIDVQLAGANEAVVQAAHLFLHQCFQTYLDEVSLCARAQAHRADRMRLQDTAWHFYRKNNLVMMLWLDLRARLLGLQPARYTAAIRRWGYLLAAFQIFDDLKDIALDLGRQPSYPLQIAANDFPAEFAWIERRFGAQRMPLTRDEVPEVNLRASRTVGQCMQWSRLIALACFDNALLYAWDQRWRKSWTRRRRSFNPVGDSARRLPVPTVHRVVQALLAMRSNDASPIVDDTQLAFALDVAAYEGSWRIYLSLFPNIRAMYRFATLGMWMTAEEKARAARKLLRRCSRAQTSELVGLLEANVDHQITGDGLETFSKLIEV